MPILPSSDLVGLRAEGSLRVVHLGRSVGAETVPIAGWRRGIRPLALCPTARRGVLVALSTSTRGTEVDLIARGRGKARVVARASAPGWCATLIPGGDRRTFLLPQGTGHAAAFRVVGGRRIVWTRLPAKGRSLPDRTVVEAGGAPAWLDVSSLRDDTLFVAYGGRAGGVAALTETTNPVRGVSVVAFWRSGRGFVALDDGGERLRFARGASEARPTGFRRGGTTFAFALDAARSRALALGLGRLRLERWSRDGASSALASCNLGGLDAGGATVLMDGRGRWGAVATLDGDAYLVRIVRGGQLVLVRRVAGFAPHPPDASPFCFDGEERV